jgi:aerobic-type carbon monoxide dehydrogenase small subunit (CoxS/CutS family)
MAAIKPRERGEPVELTINGKKQQVDVPADMPLLWVLRDVIGLTGTKFGCGAALCGACTVQLDGIPARSCVTPVSAAAGHAITTIEGIGATAEGKKVQQAWLDLEVVQCGYCQSGHSWRRTPTPAMPTSIRPCQATSAAAAPIPVSERRSSRRLTGRRSPRRESDHG